MSARGLVPWLACSIAVLALAASAEDVDKRLRKLESQLRDSKVSKQEKAFSELQALGPVAVPVVAAAWPTASYPLSQRMEAFLKQAGPDALVRVIRSSPDAEVRRRLPKLITDELVLVELAKTGPTEAAAAAVRGLSNPDPLAIVAREGTQPEVRSFARSTLADIARKDPSPERRAEAAAHVDDPAVLAELAKGGHDAVRLAVLDRIADRSLLLAIVKEHKARIDVRLAALARIDDAEALGGIASERGGAVLVRLAALRRVDDTALLLKLARGTDSPEVRIAAIRRVVDQKVLLEAATKDADEQVRLNAVALLTSRASLQQIAASEKSPHVRKVAALLARRANRGRSWAQSARDLGGSDAAAASAASELLKAAGVVAAPVLAETLADDDPAVAGAAARTLEGLGDAAIAAVSAAVLEPKAQRRALELLPQLSAKALVVVSYPSGKRYAEALAAKLKAAGDARALFVECPSGPTCEEVSRRVRIAEQVSDGDGCYDKTYFGGSFCMAVSKRVQLDVSIVRETQTLARQSFSASSPQSVPYRYYGVDSGPTTLDVEAATVKVLEGELVKLDLSALDRLLAP